MKPEEFDHALLCNYLLSNYPEVIFTTDMSGVRLHEGLRKRIARMRSDRGIPDILIFEPVGNHHGLFIEIKAQGVKVVRKDGLPVADAHIREQWVMISRLKSKGYAAFFGVGFEACRDCVKNYLADAIPQNQFNDFIYKQGGNT